MSEKVEIRTELLLAGMEQIKGDLAALKPRFDEVDKGREKAQKGFGEWMSTAHQLAGVLGVNLSMVVDKMKATGGAFIDAGSAAESGDQALAALIATTQGTKFDKALDNAEALGDRLDDIAIDAGISGQALGDAYQIVIERTGATEAGIKRATAEVDKLAIVTGKLGKDAGAVTSEYSLMAEGMVKPKGQLFQLLQSTGIFGKTTKGVSEAWAQLTDAKRAELLDYGLTKLSKQMRDMPPTFKQAEASFENMLRIGKEQIGQPLIEELTPALQDATKEIIALGPDINDFGRAMAKEVGSGIREGGRLMKEALGWVKEHRGEIADSLRSGAKAVRDAFEFVLAHKEEIGIAMGVKTAMPVLKPAYGAASSIASAGAGGGLAQFGSGLTGAAGAAASLGLLAAAIAALGGIAYAEATLISGLKDEWDTHTDSLKRLQDMAARGDVENVTNSAKTMADLDAAAGRMNPQLKEFYERVVRMAESSSRFNKQLSADDHERLKRQITNASTNKLEGTGMSAYDEQAKKEQGAGNQVTALLMSYKEAVQNGDKEMALLAAQTLASGGLVSQAMLKTSEQVEGGLDAMAEMLLASGGQFAGFAASLKGKAAAPPAPKILMPGAKITVNQDFRDKNPDAVAVVFKRDLARAAERRTSARYSGVFGM